MYILVLNHWIWPTKGVYFLMKKLKVVARFSIDSNVAHGDRKGSPLLYTKSYRHMVAAIPCGRHASSFPTLRSSYQ